MFIISIADGKSYCQEFRSLNEKVSELRDLQELKSIQKSEIKKYIDSKDPVHLFNSKYVEFYIAAHQDKQIESIKVLSQVLEMDGTEYPLQFGWFNYHMGANLAANGANKLALTYSNEAIRLAQIAKDNDLLSLSNSLTGKIHFGFQNYKQAKQYFNAAFEHFPKNEFINKASMLNNLGLCEFRQNHYNQAYSYFDSALGTLAKKKNPSMNEREFKVVISGNMGSAMHKLGYFKRAIELLEAEVQFYMNIGKDKYELAVPPLIELLEIYNLTKEPDRIDQVLMKMERVQNIVETSTEFPTLSEALFNYYEDNGPETKLKSQTTIYYKKLIDHLNEKNKRSDELNDLVYHSRIEQFKKENQAAKNESEKAKLEKSNYQILVIISFLIFLISGISLATINRSRKKRAQTELVLLEKEREIENQRLKLLDLENKEKQQEITQLAMNLMLRRETEKAFLSKINELKRKKNIDAENTLKELQISVSNLINSDKRTPSHFLGTDDILKTFKSNLSERYPQLSKSDLQYCCYFRMNMSAKEIGAIHAQSDGSVRVLKNKIKNKLGLGAEVSLSKFLQNIS